MINGEESVRANPGYIDYRLMEMTPALFQEEVGGREIPTVNPFILTVKICVVDGRRLPADQHPSKPGPFCDRGTVPAMAAAQGLPD